MKQNYKIFNSFWFVFALTTLLLNDFFLKEIYSNWLTGKLSDFAGLFIFPLFWTALFPRYKASVFWLTGFLFIFWKSGYSQSFISLWNSLGLLQLCRTIDYSDLMALVILPVSFIFEKQQEKRNIYKGLHPALPLVISVFAFMATSRTRPDRFINKTYHLDFSKTELINRLNQNDSLIYHPSIQTTSNNPDTIELIILSSFCAPKFEAKISLLENTNKTSELTFISAQFNCLGKEKEIQQLNREFERIVIDKLKTGL